MDRCSIRQRSSIGAAVSLICQSASAGFLSSCKKPSSRAAWPEIRVRNPSPPEKARRARIRNLKFPAWEMPEPESGEGSADSNSRVPLLMRGRQPRRDRLLRDYCSGREREAECRQGYSILLVTSASLRIVIVPIRPSPDTRHQSNPTDFGPSGHAALQRGSEAAHSHWN